MIRQVATGFCQWWARKTKTAVAAVKREFLFKKMHRSLSSVKDMRDSLVHHRLEQRKALEQVRLIMDSYGCGTCSVDNHVTTNTTLHSIWAPELETGIISEGHTEKIQETRETVDEDDHEYLHKADVPSVVKTRKCPHRTSISKMERLKKRRNSLFRTARTRTLWTSVKSAV